VAVSSGDRQRRHIGLSIGGIVVPQPALAQHQFLHGSSAVWQGSNLQFRDVVFSGPLEVFYGPPVDEVPTRHRGMSLFVMPQYADSPHRPVPPESPFVALP
jgi:hypothetical protein